MREMKNRFFPAWTSDCYGFEYTDIIGGGVDAITKS